MRPVVGGETALQTRSRKQSFTDPEGNITTAAPGNGAPTTFFMASESMLERTAAASLGSGSETNFGVQSMEDSVEGFHACDEVEEEDGDEGNLIHGNNRRSTIKRGVLYNRDSSVDGISQPSGSNSTSSSPRRPRPRPQGSGARISQPLTPISSASPALGLSLPDSPKSTSTLSLRHSDEESLDEGGSQAIASSGEEDADAQSPVHEAAPQLIMPSIKMPSRRPYTERGKDIGRLKILFAGDSGVGKSSLIKSIVQVCEDIVHVDPLSLNPTSLETLPSKRRENKRENAQNNPTKCITEIYASTRAYPSWWSDVEESKILRRRQSVGDSVLERNLCFVDTPGFRHGTSLLENMDSVLQYIETQMIKTSSIENMNDGDLLSLFAGNGGYQVDLVLYLISRNIEPVDIEFLRRISNMTNVIPLISKVDVLSDSDLLDLKKSISRNLRAADIRPFTFKADSSSSTEPHAVCSAPSNDEDTMDASLLMSPDYVQPLLPSELSALVERIFQKENASWLKHSAAKKLVKWKVSPRGTPKTMPNWKTELTPRFGSSIPSIFTSSSVLSMSSTTSGALTFGPQGPTSYLHAKIADHMFKEEKLAELHLANWANELRRSLQNERARCEALARGERILWLTEKLDESVRDDDFLRSQHQPSNAIMSFRGATARTFKTHKGGYIMDPLGLMRWNDTMKRRGWIAFQLMGSFGVLGAVAIWITRNWGMGVEATGAWHWGWFSMAE